MEKPFLMKKVFSLIKRNDPILKSQISLTTKSAQIRPCPFACFSDTFSALFVHLIRLTAELVPACVKCACLPEYSGANLEQGSKGLAIVCIQAMSPRTAK